MNYSMSLLTAFMVLVVLGFLQTVTFVDNSGWLPENSSLVSSASGKGSIPSVASLVIDHKTNFSTAHPALNRGNISPESSSELIAVLKDFGMWQTESPKHVAPLVVDSFPNDLSALDVNLKKKVFFTSLLPAVLTVMQEIRAERNALGVVFEKLGPEPKKLQFSDHDTEWQQLLTHDEIAFVVGLTKKYRCENGAELLRRIDVLPVSLVLAQSALESSWGTSRFARLGNNIFGMWTWSENGIVPLDRPEGMTHKLAEYDSIIDSVRAYILTINRLPAYVSLRELRSQTMDPISLSKGLLFYSERREDYVHDLQSVISYNGLTGYDQCRLSPSLKIMPLVAIRES